MILSLPIDLISEIIAHLPLADWREAVALSCVCRAATRLLTRFHALNGIVTDPDAFRRESAAGILFHGVFNIANVSDRFIQSKLKGYEDYGISDHNNYYDAVFTYICGRIITVHTHYKQYHRRMFYRMIDNEQGYHIIMVRTAIFHVGYYSIYRTVNIASSMVINLHTDNTDNTDITDSYVIALMSWREAIMRDITKLNTAWII